MPELTEGQRVSYTCHPSTGCSETHTGPVQRSWTITPTLTILEFDPEDGSDRLTVTAEDVQVMSDHVCSGRFCTVCFERAQA